MTSTRDSAELVNNLKDSAFDFNIYSSVASAKADTKLKVGDTVQTTGYYSENDGGGANYIVVAGGTGTDDGGSYHDVINGNQLELVSTSIINIRKYGGTDGADITSPMNLILSIGKSPYVPDGNYDLSNINPVNNTRVIFEKNAEINCTNGFAILCDASNLFKFSIEGGLFRGPGVSTNELFKFTNSGNLSLNRMRFEEVNGVFAFFGCTDVSISNIDIHDSIGNGIKISSGSTKFNLSDIKIRNQLLFGVLVEDNSREVNISNLIRWGDVGAMSQDFIDRATSDGQIDIPTGRVGLEGLASRHTSTFTASNVQVSDTHDNGISVSGKNCSIKGVRVENNHHDGVHIYGSFNTISGIESLENRFYGLGLQAGFGGFGRSNTIVGLHSQDNLLGDVSFSSAGYQYTLWSSGSPFSNDYCWSEGGVVNGKTQIRLYKLSGPSSGNFGTIKPTHFSGTVSDGAQDWEFVDWMFEDTATRYCSLLGYSNEQRDANNFNSISNDPTNGTNSVNLTVT